MHRPKLIQLEKLPKPQGQPTRSPLTGTADLKLSQPNLDRRSDLAGRHSILREQSHCRVFLTGAVEHLDLLGPTCLLAIVDFSEVNDLPLKALAVLRSSVFADTPIPMFFAVFL